MNQSIHFEKHECEKFAIFNCKDGGWQLSKELGYHKCSPARDYLVAWVEKDGRWSLYITGYNNYDLKQYELNECITTVDTMFDVIDYICNNKHTHY